MSVTVDLQKMTVEEKLRLMEDIWEDLSRVESDVPSPKWHGEVLEERDRKIASGTESFVDWETAKRKLREELK